MRVTCEKCRAVYAVDDKLIPAKGARAQCPKCKALQVVKRDAPAAAVAPAPAAPVSARPAPAPLPPALSAPPPPTAMPWGPKAPASAAAATTPSTVDDLLGLVASKPASSPDPFAGLPALSPAPAKIDPFRPSSNFQSGDPFENLDLGPKQPAPGPADALDPLAALGLAPPTAAPKTAPRPFDPFASPGKQPVTRGLPSVDFYKVPTRPQAQAASVAAFDPLNPPKPGPAATSEPFGAGGTLPKLDDLFGSLPAPGLDGPLPQAGGPVVSCRTCHKPLPDPFDAALGICEACRAREQHEVRGTRAAPVASPPVDPFGEPAPAAPRPAAPAGDLEFFDQPEAKQAKASRPVRSGSAERVVASGPGGGKAKWVVLGLLAVVGLGAWLGIARPAFVFNRSSKKPVLPVIQSRLMDWKLAAMGLQGTEAEHLAKGRKAFLADKPTSYLDAEEEFKAAVVLEPTDLKAVAQYVEAFAVGRGERASDEAVAEARELITAVLNVQPNMALAHRASAGLLLAMGEWEQARKEAEKALSLSTPEEEAESLLTLGCTYLKKSADIAMERIDEALKKDKLLKRALYYRGLANEYAGRYAASLADYEERLKLDPDQREALRAQARVYARLGDVQAARKPLAIFAAKHPNVGEPRVLLVELSYEVERDTKEAEKTLRELKQDEARFDDLDKLELHTLWAAVARERGDLKASAAQAEEALKIDGKWAPAHFQKMLTHLAAGEPDKARVELKLCDAKLDDVARVREYQGRIEASAGNVDAAIAAFREASNKAPGRISPRLNLAALLARKGELDQSWAAMKKALDSDPTSIARQRRQVSDFFEPPVEGIRSVAKAFEAVQDEGNWLPQIYAAVGHYHLGDADRAEAALDRVLAADPTSLAALIYRAQLELDRKRYDRAFGFAKRAVAAERQSAVAYYLQARAEEGLKKVDQARADYLLALDRDPGLEPANAHLGMLVADEDKQSAKKWLLQALAVDPDDLDARVALFKLGY